MQKVRVIKKSYLWACLLCCLLLVGCTTFQAIEDRVEVTATSQAKIYRDQWVHKAPPEVHVQPKSPAAFAPKALFVPFRITQQVDAPMTVAHAVSRVFYQTWNGMQLFPAMEYAGDNSPYRRDQALMLARQRGADIVVGGFITYLYAGGTAGATQLAIQLEVHDAVSGQLIWSLAQGGSMASHTQDYILFATKTRLPADPVQAITRALAIDMGKVVQNWLVGPTPQSRIQELDQKVHDAVFSGRDSMPAPRPRSGMSGVSDSASF